MAYARGTTVSIARSKEEIERVLARYGADSFRYLGFVQSSGIG